MPCLCLLGLHTHQLHISVASCFVLESGERAKVLELGRDMGGGRCKLSSDMGATRLCVLFAPWPKTDPGRNSQTPALHSPCLPARAIVGWEDCHAQRLPGRSWSAASTPRPRFVPCRENGGQVQCPRGLSSISPFSGSVGVPASPN